MDELNEMLLKAAGRPGTPPRTRRKGGGSSYSDDDDDGSDSRDDDDNNDSDDDDDDNDNDTDNRYPATRKPSGSQVPLKKRLDAGERGDERSSSSRDDDDNEEEDDVNGDGRYDREEESDDDVSYGSDLYKDEDDRKRLSKMTELDREMILANRANRKNDRELKNNIKKQKEKSNQSRKDTTPPHMSNRGVRSSTRSSDRTSAKDSAFSKLNELRERKKLRQQDPESHQKRRDQDSNKRKSLNSSQPRIDSGSHSEDDDSAADNSENDNESALTYEDVKGITIRRSKLAKWFMEPFFEELIVGCFVRVGIGKSKSGPIYRLCIVRNVDAADPDRQYKLENKMTHKYLNVVWGNESSAARWQMAMISDSPPIKEEYDQLMREVDRHGGRMPSKQEALEKQEAIKKTNAFVYSAETVKQMIQEKKSTIRRPLNVAAEKDRLRRDMEVAQMKHDEVEVEKIKAKLEELEASRETQQKDEKAIRLAEMNRKNRVENFKNASEVKPVTTGEAGNDPFSRRWTRSRNYYVSKSEPGTETQTAAMVGPDDSGAMATVAAQEAAVDAGKLADTGAPVDHGTESNMLHDFDLPISLAALQRFGGPHGVHAGFMARKQRIEATVGCQVPENDGRRHALTLSVSDYKRRRGLL